MKRKMAVMLAVAMGTTLLSGCGGGSTGGGTNSSTTAAAQATEAAAADASNYEVTKPITIKWWHALEEQYTGTVDKMVEDFNKSQDMITVEAEYIGSYSKINEALVAAHAAGTDLPAITVANTPYIAEYGAGGLTEDLTPYIEATGFDIDDLGNGMVKATQYDGRQVALPFLISTQVMYYNKDMADEMNITIPEKWDDMDSFLETVTKFNSDGSTAVYGTIIPGWDQWYFETFFLNNGVKIINDDQVTTDLGGDASMAITKKIKEWCDKGYTYWTGTADDASSIMRQHFFDKEAFSVVHTSSLYNTYVSKCDFNVGMAWLPGGATSNQEIGGCALVIPSKNDQETKNAAWQFMQYLVSKDVNMVWATDTGYMPTRKSVLETEAGTEFLKEKPAFQCIFDNLDLINPRIQHKAWSQLATIWKNSLAEILMEDSDMDAIMKQMSDEIDDVLGDA